MKLKLIAISLFLFSSVAISQAQEKAPLLKGTVNISIKEGTMECDLALTDIPYIEDYLILINAGMNIRYLRNLDDTYSFSYERTYDDEASYECFGYYMNNNKGKFLPMPGLRFNYTGKFPVVDDTSKSANGGDRKGNIAFNGMSVRSDGSQAGWYPTLYDVKNEKSYDNVRYDLEIVCKDCNAIYLNGNAPVKGSTAHLKMDKPAEIMLYAGNYDWYNDGETYFLNPNFDRSEMEGYGKMVNNFKEYYVDKLYIPYGSPITYINSTPVSKLNGWYWVSYPSIIAVGHGDNGLKGVLSNKVSQPFMAHELGHYYFGNVREFNSELGDMLSESFAEYLSFQVSRDIIKDSTYEHTIAKKIRQLKDFKATPIASIKKEADYKNRELYVYYYAPLLYVAIEKEIGIENMWKWMNKILTTDTKRTDYAFIESTLSSVLKDEKKVQQIRDKYFSSEKALDNAITKINTK